jgi:dipeptidyl aminopeptidase/acylaminoacyl peptidase
VASLALPQTGRPKGSRDLTPLDVVLMKSVTGAFPSPDGSLIAFTRSEPRPPEDGPGAGYSGLYLLDEAGAERPLAAGRRSIGGVAWDPRGTRITFLESREGDPGTPALCPLSHRR